jgi:hypothetical protein
MVRYFYLCFVLPLAGCGPTSSGVTPTATSLSPTTPGNGQASSATPVAGATPQQSIPLPPTPAAPTPAAPTPISAPKSPVSSAPLPSPAILNDADFDKERQRYDQAIRSAATSGELQQLDSQLEAMEAGIKRAIAERNAKADYTMNHQTGIQLSTIAQLRTAAQYRMKGGAANQKAAELNLNAGRSTSQQQAPSVSVETVR